MNVIEMTRDYQLCISLTRASTEVDFPLRNWRGHVSKYSIVFRLLVQVPDEKTNHCNQSIARTVSIACWWWIAGGLMNLYVSYVVSTSSAPHRLSPYLSISEHYMERGASCQLKRSWFTENVK